MCTDWIRYMDTGVKQVIIHSGLDTCTHTGVIPVIST